MGSFITGVYSDIEYIIKRLILITLLFMILGMSY